MKELYKLGLALLTVLPLAAPLGSTTASAATVCEQDVTFFWTPQVQLTTPGGTYQENITGGACETATVLPLPALTPGAPPPNVSGKFTAIGSACLAATLTQNASTKLGVAIGLAVIVLADPAAPSAELDVTTPTGVPPCLTSPVATSSGVGVVVSATP